MKKLWIARIATALLAVLALVMTLQMIRNLTLARRLEAHQEQVDQRIEEIMQKEQLRERLGQLYEELDALEGGVTP